MPLLITLSLWVYFGLYQEALFAALLMSGYTLFVYFTAFKQTFDGVIELTETREGTKSFQLIVNKDPETFQDQDQVVFLFKEVS